MPANYPTSNPDGPATGVGTTDASTATPNTHAGFHDQLASEVVAIGTDLVLARGASASLDAKIKAIETGWAISSDTWVYASATTFTIAGVDRTAQLTKGTRISYNDGAIDYGVVEKAVFATNTTVTLLINNDYSIANAVLTAPRYSYHVNPQGYPTWFNYTPTITGFSTNPTNAVYRWRAVGSECLITVREATAGTSNATTKTYSLPSLVAATVANASWTGPSAAADNGTNITTACSLSVGSASATFTSSPNALSSGTWTASGGCRIIFGSLVYQF